jgi:hypothetical protein
MQRDACRTVIVTVDDYYSVTNDTPVAVRTRRSKNSRRPWRGNAFNARYMLDAREGAYGACNGTSIVGLINARID